MKKIDKESNCPTLAGAFFSIILITLTGLLHVPVSQAGVFSKLLTPQCREAVGGNFYQDQFDTQYKDSDPIMWNVNPTDQSVSESNGRLLEKLKGLEFDGEIAEFSWRERIRFESRKEAEEYVENQNRDGQLISFKKGLASLDFNYQGIALTSFPPHYSNKLKENLRVLTDRGISVMVGNELGLSAELAGVLRSSHRFNSSTATGVIILKPSELSQALLQHEMQHAFDVVLESDIFLDSLPVVSRKIADLVKREIENKEKSGEEFNWVEKQQIKAIRSIPKSALEMKASGIVIRDYLSARGFREMVLPPGRVRELKVIFDDLVNYSIYTFRLAYHQIWLDPGNPKNIVLVLKATVSGTIASMTVLVPFGAIGGGIGIMLGSL